MTYLQVNSDGSTSPLGTITGYRVEYKHKGHDRQTRPFTTLWHAFGFQQHLRMGQASKIVPVYSRK